MGGREGDLRSLIDNLDTLATTLDAQSGSITAAMEGLDRLSGTFAEQRSTVAAALEDLPGGIETARAQRKRLTAALHAMSKFSTVATQVIDESNDDLVASVRSVQPAQRAIGREHTRT